MLTRCCTCLVESVVIKWLHSWEKRLDLNLVHRYFYTESQHLIVCTSWQCPAHDNIEMGQKIVMPDLDLGSATGSHNHIYRQMGLCVVATLCHITHSAFVPWCEVRINLFSPSDTASAINPFGLMWFVLLLEIHTNSLALIRATSAQQHLVHGSASHPGSSLLSPLNCTALKQKTWD